MNPRIIDHIIERKHDSMNQAPHSPTSSPDNNLLLDARRYRGMDRQSLGSAYDNTGAVLDSPDWLQRWRERSAVLRAGHDRLLDIPYGDGERQKLDYFACGKAQAPLFVFLHGGYWQRNSRDMFSFVAEGPLAHGFDVAVVGYTLAPQASLHAILMECHAALDYLMVADTSTGDMRFDRDQLFVGGWSAGGHLATTLSCSRTDIRGVLSISGIFDLEPVALCALNDKLQLSMEEAALLSPLHRVASSQTTVCAAVGTRELPELQRQSQNYLEAARSVNAPVWMEPIPDRNHFSILDELYLSDGKLVQALCRLKDCCVIPSPN